MRLDGKAFHTYCRRFEKPFDMRLVHFMDAAAMALCTEIQGAQFAYVQSDEISILLTDFATIKTDAWFDGCIQKMVSVSASVATQAFNDVARVYMGIQDYRHAHFDSRVFTIPDPIEVANYFICRQKDCVRNSIQMVAQSLYSHKQLYKKNCDELQEMIFAKGINWNNYNPGLKRGRVIHSQPEVGGLASYDAPIFTQDRSFLRDYIPIHPDFLRKPEEIENA
jgi:tRNA(His) 5'-end guanylyltransferase